MIGPVILAAVVIAAMFGGFALAGKVVISPVAHMIVGVLFGFGLIVAAAALLLGVAFAGCHIISSGSH